VSKDAAPERIAIIWSPEARADLRTIERGTAMQILHCVGRYLVSRTGDVKKLKPPFSGFRCHCGDYRVFFDPKDENAIEIAGVRNRREAYRWIREWGGASRSQPGTSARLSEYAKVVRFSVSASVTLPASTHNGERVTSRRDWTTGREPLQAYPFQAWPPLAIGRADSTGAITYRLDVGNYHAYVLRPLVLLQ
jgi:mRNA-degrading endonuclease RelE of RelBE toxin-antitoxin system